MYTTGNELRRKEMEYVVLMLFPGCAVFKSVLNSQIVQLQDTLQKLHAKLAAETEYSN